MLSSQKRHALPMKGIFMASRSLTPVPTRSRTRIAASSSRLPSSSAARRALQRCRKWATRSASPPPASPAAAGERPRSRAPSTSAA